MKEEKNFPIVNKDKQEIKLYEGNKESINSFSILELSIAKCPITCNKCKTVYSNKPTGIRIVCRCLCHNQKKGEKFIES